MVMICALSNLFFLLINAVDPIMGDVTDYSISTSSLILGAGAGPINTVNGAMECFNFIAINDSIKEDEEKFKLLLNSTDAAVCLCRDLAHVSIEKDPFDGKSSWQDIVEHLYVVTKT